MSNGNQQPEKKPFPGSFLLFLLAAVLLVVLIQNFMSTRMGRVAFSYQVEHLANLDLVEPQDSRKVALNDHLVTFSGQFRAQRTEAGKQRFKFLQLLDEHQRLQGRVDQLGKELDSQAGQVRQSSQWFLQLTGEPIPAGGYVVVGSTYDTPERRNSIDITQVAPYNGITLSQLQSTLDQMSVQPTDGELQSFGAGLQDLIANFRSPFLGIGDETMKSQLQQVDQEVQQGAQSGAQTKAIYASALQALSGLVNQLNQPVNDVRLSQLRSVRDDVELIGTYRAAVTALHDNSVQLDKAAQAVGNVVWFFNNQELSTRGLMQQNPEVYGPWYSDAKAEWDAFDENRGLPFKAPDQPRNLVLEKTFKSVEPAPNYVSYLFTALPVLLVVLLLYFVFSRQMKGGMGGGALNFGKSPAKLLQKGQVNVTFKDVAGIDEAKEELVEIVDFLKNPKKFTSLGGRIPKGVLCIGPPGTGKTLIAKAVAGEADRPFFSISGSDFVEMFVGVGASRIRDLFETAKRQAPCIIFIDEIDAVGRHRGAGIGGGHDEREQTLNQLLVEMDGFDTSEGIIIMAATNRPDVLDRALLRPGRFDRRVIIDLPDLKGRYEILKVHARKLKLDASVDLMSTARATPGASGADLANLLNEAALLAARRGRTAITEPEVREATDKVRYGKERRSLEIDAQERRTTAYHESGHAIVSCLVKGSEPLDKVTVIPRGFSLGATHFLPKKNRLSYWKQELYDQLAVLMGGRSAEEIFVGDVSSGAQQDFSQATSLARNMVCMWGMSDKVGAVAYEEKSDNGQYLGLAPYTEKNYSETTAKLIDDEVRTLIDTAHNRARTILEEHREQVELMANMLIEFETLDGSDVRDILEGRWNAEKKREQLSAASNRFKASTQFMPPPPPRRAKPKLNESPA
jgi:cell division protease FtsH